MSSKVEPVFFDNRDKVRLFGILHRPEYARRDVCIVILSPGIKSRVAPHRLYIKMAKRFCEMGFFVLRLDPHGIGDSEGEIEEHMAADFYASVQVGRFVNDTIDAMNWMERENGISRYILAGLCGGAITGLLAGAMDKRVCSLLGLGIPVILDSATTDQTKYMTKGQLENLRDSYLKKLINLKAWLRFFAFKSDYRLILKSLMTSMRKRDSSTNTVRHLDSQLSETDSNHTANNLNPYFPPAFHKFLSSRKMLLIFSEADRLYWEFEEKYSFSYKNEYEKYKTNVEIYVAKDANHIFSFKAWQEQMLNISCEWLMRQ